MDHDQRFKVLLREFPEDFFRLFFPRVARQFDFARLEWIETELFPDPPEGERRAVDLVAKLPLAGGRGKRSASDLSELLALIHLEVDASESPGEFGRRMLWYYMSLRQRHDLPVLPVAVFLKARARGLGKEEYNERCGVVDVVRFEYLSVGLPSLESLKYVRKRNRLAPAMAALMRVPPGKEAEVKLEAYKRIARGTTNNFQRFLLLNCIDAYLRMAPGETRRFDRMIQEQEHSEVRRMVQTSMERTVEKASKEAAQEARRRMIQLYVEDRFGATPPALRKQIAEWPPGELEELFLRIVRARSLEELKL